jgi:hypothetical protein
VRRAKHADEFVPTIVGCDVLGEDTLEAGEIVIIRTAAFVNEVPGQPNTWAGEPHLIKPCSLSSMDEDSSILLTFIAHSIISIAIAIVVPASILSLQVQLVLRMVCQKQFHT